MIDWSWASSAGLLIIVLRQTKSSRYEDVIETPIVPSISKLTIRIFCLTFLGYLSAKLKMQNLQCGVFSSLNSVPRKWKRQLNSCCARKAYIALTSCSIMYHSSFRKQQLHSKWSYQSSTDLYNKSLIHRSNIKMLSINFFRLTFKNNEQ